MNASQVLMPRWRRYGKNLLAIKIIDVKYTHVQLNTFHMHACFKINSGKWFTMRLLLKTMPMHIITVKSLRPIFKVSIHNNYYTVSPILRSPLEFHSRRPPLLLWVHSHTLPLPKWPLARWTDKSWDCVLRSLQRGHHVSRRTIEWVG